MNYKLILRALSALWIVLSFTMFLPLICSMYYQEGDFLPIFLSMIFTFIPGVFIFLLLRNIEREEMTHREAFAIVSFGWISAGFFGSLPFYFSGLPDGFINCYFEAISGFTTTGATVLTRIEEVPHGILFWRSLTHWLGGMGIILLSIAILPLLGVGGMQLYKAEVPGPIPDKLQPRIVETARVLWEVYLLFSVVETLLLLLGGMNLFDALTHTFGTIATGGFSTKSASIAYFASPYIDTVIILFMILAGTNFSLHYGALKGNSSVFWKNPEFKLYTGILFASIILVTINLRSGLGNLFTSLRLGAFQVTSILTTTGYTTADYEQWPFFSQYIILLLMFVGGCAGSTGGGIKCLRYLILFKQMYAEVYRLIHPRAVVPIKIGGKIISDEVITSVWGLFTLYSLIIFFSTMILILLGLDPLSSFGSIVATIGNIGPGFGIIGPSGTYLTIPGMGKIVLIICMILGRLEIYTLVIMLIPEFWKK
ncbi:MAG: TrkH family potassium uptake protein [Thermodesulfobacteriota bacterium]|nr:TrkH family potassium uptake protein [Thermodesulfobacteriota bacterium]